MLPDSLTQPTVLITDAKRKVLYDRSRKLFSDGLAFGVRHHMNVAAAFWNIKRFELFKIDGFRTWTEYSQSAEISRQYIYQYVKIADGLLSHMPRAASSLDEPFCFTQKDLDDCIAKVSDQFRSLTFVQLYGLSKRFEEFSNALKGVALPESDILSLAPSSTSNRQASRPAKIIAFEPDHLSPIIKRRMIADQTESGSTETSELTAIPDVSTPAEVAEENGWNWHPEDRRFKHVDGDQLQEGELAMLETKESALRVWQLLQEETARYRTQVFKLLKSDGPCYIRYHISNKDAKVVAESTKSRAAIQRTISEIDRAIDMLLDGDTDRIQQIKRFGLDE